ncbi:uncharacterized protein N0V89_012531 [Didymosphaeria variabile]|uniref:Uncharacterized protein n=1 Tax=Didymosphaeria variabile TaxID=1932322 RepID=A0A9W9C550_9PLEO|nr:uncharacterized protein N0V89_012531 [Didymosphaeria variabile]KAJ4344787.1 hypothetical protein N0V89_012531 [Didymosphaeria variabile]
MKFPKRKKRGPISAHTAATTPIGLSPALSTVRSIVEHMTPVSDTTKPKLRRKRKIENLHLESVIDAELTQIDRVTGHVVAIPLGRARALSAPVIIITPPSPEKDDPLDKAGCKLARTDTMDTPPRSLSLGDLSLIATAAGRALLSVIPYWWTPAVEAQEPSEQNGGLVEQDLAEEFTLI